MPLVLVYGYYQLDVYGIFVEGSNELRLSPYWSNSYVTIIYDGNGGIGHMDNHMLDPYGGGQPLHENRYVREGYEFSGWSQYPDGGDDDFIADSYFYPSYDDVDKTITLDAQWRKIES